jgi:hypothetical protein
MLWRAGLVTADVIWLKLLLSEDAFMFTVKHSFTIEGRGLVLVPEPCIEGDTFDIHDHLKIIRPDGTEIRSTIRSIEILSSRTESTWVVMIWKSLTASDVPPGSTFCAI